jgi:hypothetical protein
MPYSMLKKLKEIMLDYRKKPDNNAKFNAALDRLIESIQEVMPFF